MAEGLSVKPVRAITWTEVGGREAVIHGGRLKDANQRVAYAEQREIAFCDTPGREAGTRRAGEGSELESGAASDPRHQHRGWDGRRGGDDSAEREGERRKTRHRRERRANQTRKSEDHRKRRKIERLCDAQDQNRSAPRTGHSHRFLRHFRHALGVHHPINFRLLPAASSAALRIICLLRTATARSIWRISTVRVMAATVHAASARPSASTSPAFCAAKVP